MEAGSWQEDWTFPNESLLMIFYSSPEVMVVCRFVCRHWKNILPKPKRFESGKDFLCRVAEGGHITVLQWARSQGCRWDRHLAYAAAKAGHLEILQWLSKSGCPWVENYPHPANTPRGWMGCACGLWHPRFGYDKAIYKSAIEGGQQIIIDWINQEIAPDGRLENNPDLPMAVCRSGRKEMIERWCEIGTKWSVDTDFRELVASGNLDTIVWAIEGKIFPLSHSRGYGEDVLSKAAACGHLHLVRWAVDVAGAHWTRYSMVTALSLGHYSIVDWAVSRWGWVDCTCEDKGTTAKTVSDLLYLQTMRETGCPWGDYNCSRARVTSDHVTTDYRVRNAHMKWAIEQKCPWGHLTCVDLVSDLTLLQLARERGCPWGLKIVERAMFQGIEIFKWVLENGAPLDSSTTCRDAWMSNNQEVIRLAFEWGLPLGTLTCTDLVELPSCVDLLRYAREEKGCPWETNSTCFVAAKNGNLEALHWLLENQCPIKDKEGLFKTAIGGSAPIKVIDLLNQHGICCPDNTLEMVASLGKIELLQKIVEGGYGWGSYTCPQAKKYGGQKHLEWAVSKGCPWHPQTCVLAEKQMEFIQWAIEHGCPWGNYDCLRAATLFGTDHLVWARRHKCPWGNYTWQHAASLGGKRQLKWAMQTKCPMGRWTVSAAVRFGDVDILKAGKIFGCPPSQNARASCLAARSGRVDILEWLLENDHPWDATVCTAAAQGGQLACLKWLRDKGCPWDEATFKAASKRKDSEMLQWLSKNGCPQEK